MKSGDTVNQTGKKEYVHLNTLESHEEPSQLAIMDYAISTIRRFSGTLKAKDRNTDKENNVKVTVNNTVKKDNCVRVIYKKALQTTFGERNVIVKCVYRFSQYQSASLAFYQKRYALEPNVEVSIISMPKELSNDSLMELESFLGRIAIDIKLVQRWLHDCGFVYKVTMADLYKQFK